MCELLGLSSNLPATLSLSLERLAEHGGPPTSIRDGWGVAYYDGADVRLIKDAGPANESDWLRFVAHHDLRSPIVLAHIRKATVGAPSYRNAQPFVREMAGRMHSFAHNGGLPGLFETAALRSFRFSPVGETDSEQAFCALLERLSAIWARRGDIPPLEDRLSIVTAFAAELRRLGPANFLYSDGDALFAHGDRRKSEATGAVAAPDLVFIEHECPLTGATITCNGLAVTAANQAVSLVASVPLSASRWRAMAQGDVTVFRAGRMASDLVAMLRENPPAGWSPSALRGATSALKLNGRLAGAGARAGSPPFDRASVRKFLAANTPFRSAFRRRHGAPTHRTCARCSTWSARSGGPRRSPTSQDRGARSTTRSSNFA